MSKRTCSVKGCDRPHSARDLCSMHYDAKRDASPERRAAAKVRVARYRATPKGQATNERSVAIYHAKHKARIRTQANSPEAAAKRARWRAVRSEKAEWKASHITDEQFRRARKRGVDAQRVTRAYLAARNGGICGICQRVVSPDVRWPNPLSASMDHIVPLSLGGAHTADNLQLAHLICNVRKGNRATA